MNNLNTAPVRLEIFPGVTGLLAHLPVGGTVGLDLRRAQPLEHKPVAESFPDMLAEQHFL
jgi:hypothetical protein